MPAMRCTERDLEQAVALARQSLLAAFGRVDEPVVPPQLGEPGACFVTLLKDGQLRGCIGTLEAHQSLGQDIIDNARRAAFSDPRFAPVSETELARLTLEVSVLTEPVALEVADENSLLASLRPGEDGLIVEYGGRRATFLPSVWEQLPEPRQFVAALKRKAGLAAELDAGMMRWWRYGTEHAQGAVLGA